jgi:hypothetical protein
MAPRPLLVIPFIALLTAATAACGGASINTPVGRMTISTPTAAPRTATPHPAPAAKASTTTVTATAAAARPARTASPATSAASFTPFVGEWVGHTRGVTVSRNGRLEAHVGDGCCHPVIDLVLQLSNPHRVGSSWVATSRVISAEVHDGWNDTEQPAPEPGDRGTVMIGVDHILVDSISGNGFCDPDRTSPGTCGA